MRDNISLTVQDRDMQWKTNKESIVAYRMAPLSVPLSDIEVTFIETFITPIARET